MNPRQPILNELLQLQSTLPAEAVVNPYGVPEGYFDNLAEALLKKLKQEHSAQDEIASLSPLLARLSRSMPYEVPAGFFENSAPVVEEAALPQVLLQAGKAMPYQVPSGYFEQLPEILLGRVEQPKAKVVSMSRRWMRVAAAAVIAGAIAISGFLYFNSRPGTAVSVDSPQWVAKKLKDVETKELEQFIEVADVAIAQNKPKSKPVATNTALDAKSLLKDVSNEDLRSFLDEVPVDDEEIILLN